MYRFIDGNGYAICDGCRKCVDTDLSPDEYMERYPKVFICKGCKAELNQRKREAEHDDNRR